MKKVSILASALLLSMLLGACGGGGGSSSTESSAATSSAASTSSSVSSSASSSVASSSSSAAASSAATAAVTIHMLGDSTMTIYTEDRRPQAGWGEKIGLFFNSNTTIKNWAAGGRSTRSFYYETGMWDSAKAAIQAGDYVIIQFGHNDQKYGVDDATTPSADTSTGPYSKYGTYAICSDPAITDGEACTGGVDVVAAAHTRDEHSYYQFLKRYITEIRAKGATPVLMTPMVRLDVSGGVVTAAGQHDYSATKKGTEANPRGNYPAAMKAVASKYSVPLVDITTETASIVNAFGKDAAAASLYVSGDSTHPQIMFASLIAKKAVAGMKADSSLSALHAYMSTTATAIVSPSALAFGGVTVNATSTKTIAVAAFGLSPAAGNVSLSAAAGFQLSTDQSTWAQTLDVAYSNGEATQLVYVRFAPTSGQAYSGNITAMQGGSNVGSVAVSGTGVAAISDYTQWFSNGTDTAGLVTGGRMTATAASVSGLTEPTSANAVVWTAEGATVIPQRYQALDWIQRDDNKYIQFAVKPSVAMSLSKISMYFASYGGSNLRADIAYSLSSDFSNSVTLNGSTPLVSPKETLTLANYSLTTPVAVSAGTTIYVRVFPWQKSSTTGTKGIALYNVLVGGVTP